MKIKTLDDLRDDVLEVYSDLRNGQMKREDAAELFNGSGKVFAALKVQLAYYALRGEAPDLPFIGKPGKPMKTIGLENSASAGILEPGERVVPRGADA